MQDIERMLTERLSSSGAGLSGMSVGAVADTAGCASDGASPNTGTSTRRVAILGCGSTLRGDDAAGTQIALELSDLDGRARAFAGYVAPENLTGEIKQFAPDIILLIDAVELGSEALPGEVRLIDSDDIGGVSFSTHMLPLKIVVNYLTQETGAELILLGIQTANMEFMSDMSPEVKATVDNLTKLLRALLC